MENQMPTSTHTIQVYRLFERVWHWSQVASIFVLIFTGLAIHGVNSLIDFDTAVSVHTAVALALLLLWIFAFFWLFTTGQWRHYIPTTKNLLQVSRYYAYGIFKGEHHPYRKTYLRKHNPLQAMTYLLVKVVIFPAIWISGIAYLLVSIGQGDFLGPVDMEFIALFHSIAAIAVIVFIIAHIYLLTTGHTFIEHVKPMITGNDDVELTVEELAYIMSDEPQKLKGDSRDP
jgi:thiosulfate reductase cytochrome b subunit